MSARVSLSAGCARMARTAGAALATGCVLLGTSLASTPASAADPWLDRVRRFEPGASSGFGADKLPSVVLGRPQGAGALQGSLDVVSLGSGGVIEVRFTDNAMFDAAGDDLVIYENAFHAGDENGPLFTELAFVEVSRDGRTWKMLPYDAQTTQGLAGREPVYANTANAIDPLAPEAGGDRFDIAAVGLDYVTAIRITDAGDLIDDYGNHSYAGTKGGFDLDAAAALHWTPMAALHGVVTEGGAAAAAVRVRVRGVTEQRWRRRKTRPDGSYSFRRLLPQGDYVVRAGRSRGDEQEASAFLGLEQMRLEVNFSLP